MRKQLANTLYATTLATSEVDINSITALEAELAKTSTLASSSAFNACSIPLKGCMLLEVSRVNTALALKYLLNYALIQDTIMSQGTADQQAQFLSQPNSISTLWSTSCPCTFTPTIGGYNLNGKVRVVRFVNSHEESSFVVWCRRQDDKSELGAFVIDSSVLKIKDIEQEQQGDSNHLSQVRDVIALTHLLNDTFIPLTCRLKISKRTNGFNDYVLPQAVVLSSWLILGVLIKCHEEFDDQLLRSTRNKQVHVQMTWQITETLALLMRVSSMLQMNSLSSEKAREFQQYFRIKLSSIFDVLRVAIDLATARIVESQVSCLLELFESMFVV